MKLSQQELSQLNQLAKQAEEVKTIIGTLEIQKHNHLHKAAKIQSEMNKYEQELIAKYGVDSVIDMQTGEVTTKHTE